MSLVGNIYLTPSRRRIVVHRDTEDGEGVYYESLPYDGSSGATCGPGARQRFVHDYGEPVARMRFEGAYQLYMKQRRKGVKQ